MTSLNACGKSGRKIVSNEEAVNSELIGMLKCSKRGAEIPKKYFHKGKKYGEKSEGIINEPLDR